MCIAALRMAVGVAVLPGDETAGTGSVPMLSTFLGGIILRNCMAECDATGEKQGRIAAIAVLPQL